MISIARPLFTVALATLFLSIGHAQDPSIRVTYKSVAVPARKAIADIAKQSKVDLAVLPPLDQEPIILRLNNAPLKNVLDKLAEVLDGTWQQQGNAFTLSRSDDVQEALKQKARASRVADIAEDLKKIRAKLKTKPLDDELIKQLLPKLVMSYTHDPNTGGMSATAGEEMQKSIEMGATYRLCDEVVMALDPEQLADQEDTDDLHVVLSNDPHPLERKLDISPGELQLMVDEQNRWLQACNKFQESTEGSAFFGGAAFHKIDPSDVRLVVTVYGTPSEQLSVTVALVDSKEHEYEQANNFYDAFDEAVGGVLVKPEPPQPNPFLKLGLAPVKLSPEAQEIREIVVGVDQNNSENLRAAAKNVQDLLIDTADHDPLSFAPSEVLIGIAEQKDWNMIARLADTDFISAGSESLRESDPANFLFQRQEQSNVSISDGWLTICPQDVLGVEEERANRQALADYTKSVRDNGYSSIDAEGEFLASGGPLMSDYLACQYALLMNPQCTSFGGNEYVTHDDALRFYGLLAADQRDALKQGKQLAVSDLNEQQLDAFARLLIRPPLPDSTVQQKYTLFETVDTSDPDPMPQYSDEPAELFGSPAPQGAFVSARFNGGHSLKQRWAPDPDEQDMPMDMWTDPQEVGWQESREGEREPRRTYAWAEKDDVHLALTLSPAMTLTTLLRDYRGRLSPWGPISALPDDLRKAIADATRNSPFGGNPTFVPSDEGAPDKAGGSDGAPPPPPRRGRVTLR